MNIEYSEHLHYKLLTLTGEVDLSNSSEVRKCLLEILASGQSIIVDFSKLDYIDSSGMATLVEGLNVAKKNELQLLISSAKGAPKQVLELTRLDQVFTIVASLSEIKD